MTTMIDITRALPCTIPCIRVYKNEAVISAPAARLLEIPENPGSRVVIRQDLDEAVRGRDRVYIGRCDTSAGFPVAKKGLRYRLISSSLVRQLVTHLEGYGTYRIDGETPVRDGGITYYEIFFRRYE